MEIYVVDIETTGLKGYPIDYVVEIAIMRANIRKQTVEQIFHSIIRYDIRNWDKKTRKAWIFEQGHLNLNDVQNAEEDPDQVASRIQKILQNKTVTSYNTNFDFDLFLKNDPWLITEENCGIRFAPCILKSSSDYIKIPAKKRGLKLVSLEIAKECVLREDVLCLSKNSKLKQQIDKLGAHRARFDAFYAACILLELYQLNKYNLVPKIYYSHPMSIYGTNEEKEELEILEENYPVSEIFNPSDYKEEWKTLNGKEIMKKCFDKIKKSDIVVFSGIRKENKCFIGKGVYEEVMFAKKTGKTVYYIQKNLIKNVLLHKYNEDDWAEKYAIVQTEF